MVDLACRHLTPGPIFYALCETPKCLPDSIQILTPCTLGNPAVHRIVKTLQFPLPVTTTVWVDLTDLLHERASQLNGSLVRFTMTPNGVADYSK